MSNYINLKWKPNVSSVAYTQRQGFYTVSNVPQLNNMFMSVDIREARLMLANQIKRTAESRSKLKLTTSVVFDDESHKLLINVDGKQSTVNFIVTDGEHVRIVYFRNGSHFNTTVKTTKLARKEWKSLVKFGYRKAA